jgi:hypothetical protein
MKPDQNEKQSSASYQTTCTHALYGAPDAWADGTSQGLLQSPESSYPSTNVAPCGAPWADGTSQNLELSSASTSTQELSSQATSVSPSSPFLQPHVPPNSPGAELSPQYVTTDRLKELFVDVLREVRGLSDSSKSAETGPSAKPEAGSSAEKGDGKKDRIRASKIDFKTVNEVYAPCSLK